MLSDNDKNRGLVEEKWWLLTERDARAYEVEDLWWMVGPRMEATASRTRAWCFGNVGMVRALDDGG